MCSLPKNIVWSEFYYLGPKNERYTKTKWNLLVLKFKVFFKKRYLRVKIGNISEFIS